MGIFAGCAEKESPSATASASKSSTVTGSKTTSRSSVASGTKATGTAAASSAAQTAGSTQTDETQTDETDEITDEEASVPDEDSSTTPVESAKTYDLQGRVIDMMSFSPAQLPKSASDGGTRIYDVQYKLMKEAEEKFNCKFNIVTVSNTTILQSEVETSFLAGVRYADAAMLYAQRIFPKYEQQQIIMPLNDYIDFTLPVYNQAEFDQVRGFLDPGKYYGFFRCAKMSPVCLFYNKNLLDKDGIPDLHTFALQGNWNWNVFVDIARQLTHDYDGDGVIDQWGFGSDSAVSMCGAMLKSNLASVVDRNEDGKFVYNLTSAKALKALQFTSDLFHTYKVTANTNLRTGFINGTVAMYQGVNWSAATYYKFADLGLNFGAELLPSGPDNLAGNAYMRDSSDLPWFFLSNNDKDAEAIVNAAAWWNVNWDNTKSDYVTFDEMNLSNCQFWFAGIRDSEMEVQRAMDIYKYELKIDYVSHFSAATSLVNEIYKKIAAERVSPAADIESIKLQVQDIIDEVIR
ncbi:MAG: extracellular solute-binding protein, partial [Eubacteriales bacterium]|nr:extracellular solute-binding protein [Eubacteriales bacterium]